MTDNRLKHKNSDSPLPFCYVGWETISQSFSLIFTTPPSLSVGMPFPVFS
jgi:hypothetical protein